jgi:hypothetical protein
MDGLGNNLLANGVLALAYVGYKILDRCMHSKCKYTKDDGFAFDLDGADEGTEQCPVSDMQKIAELLKSRAMVHGRGGTTRVQQLV